jgi:hypothetical protein
MNERALKALLGVAFAAITMVAASSEARADETTKAVSNGKGDYTYEFGDGDKLTADGLGARGGTIVVHGSKNRERLIRPRLNFVAELLKSVENI